MDRSLLPFHYAFHSAHGHVKERICPFQIVKRPVHPTASPKEIAACFSDQDMVVSVYNELVNFFGIIQLVMTFIKGFFYLLIIVTAVLYFFPSFLLNAEVKISF